MDNITFDMPHHMEVEEHLGYELVVASFGCDRVDIQPVVDILEELAIQNQVVGEIHVVFHSDCMFEDLRDHPKMLLMYFAMV